MNSGKLRLWALFLVINITGFGALALAFIKGWVSLVLERDTSGISATIFVLFLFGLVLCYFRVRALNANFDDLANNRGERLMKYRQVARISQSNATEALKLVLGRKLMWVNTILYHLPALGLLGTVLGIAMGLEGSVMQNAESIADVVDKVFFQIVAGLSIAFYTTIVGVVFMIWLGVNVKLLEIESVRFIHEMLEASHDDTLAALEAGKGAVADGSASATESTESTEKKGD